MDTIPCPNCGKQIQVTQALKHQLEEKIRINEQAKHKVELEKIKVQTAALTEKRLKDVSQKELEKSENEKKLLEKKLEKEKAGKDQFERKIKEDALKNAEEEQRLKFKEKDLQLEEKLHAQFPNDEFLPIPKGIEGADICQKILYQGKIVGSILWETKRTKAWSSAWINKLKEDLVKTNASEAILISQVLPNDSNSFDRKNGILIAKYEHAISLGRFVRFLLTNVAIVKSSTSHTEEEWGKIRDYMMGDAFKHRMQAHFEVIKSLKDNLDAEKRTSMLRWKREESIINKIDSNTTNFYGELKAIVPQLPQIDGAETPIDNST